MDEAMKCEFSFNPYRKESPDWSDSFFDFLKSSDMGEFHRSIDGYAETPVVSLPKLADELGLGEILIKNEAHRYGINAFKGLGASYAIYRFLKGQWQKKFDDAFSPAGFKDPATMQRLGSFTFCAATDGNHGKAVAWTANKLKQRAVIYMPDNSAQARIDNITKENAEVVLVPGTFDDCVEKCAGDAAKNGWQVIGDTAYPGYMEIPQYIILGYSTIFRELESSVCKPGKPDLDLVFLPAGVGGVAAAGASYFTLRYGKDRPKLVCVEPNESDCFLESIKNGNGDPLFTKGNQMSIMAGLNCGMPSLIAWPIVRDSMDLFLGVPDSWAEAGMRAYFREGVVSGESGSSAMAGLLALMTSDEMRAARERLGLGRHTRALVLNSEGATDPVNYQRVTAEPFYPF
jgi:diaminopropionate ammonia-lyase